MNKLRRFYNQNRYIIWIVIIVIIAIISLIQILDNFALKKSKQENLDGNNEENTKLNKNYSVLTGFEVKEEISEIIDEFINYCNNNDVKMAYNLLSNECKKELYPTLDEFTRNYHNRIFKEKKTGIYQAWIAEKNNYIYKVDFTKDMLATGSVSKTSITDYYTVVKESNGRKLNINKFIGIEELNKEVNKNNIAIKVNKKIMYMDYEIYEIEIENNTQYEIILDTLESTETVYVEDENEQKYYWYNNELFENDVTIKNGDSKKIEIKFDKDYQPTRKTEKMIFTCVKIDNQNEIMFEIAI